MKKYVSILMLALAGFAFTACEDVPEPYTINLGSGGSGSSSATVEPAGSGTAADPYNVAAAVEYARGLEADVNSPTVYVKGIVSQIDDIDTGSYGNATYYISDDGTPTGQLEVYRGYGLNGEKFKNADDIKLGDVVIVMGQLVNFRGNTLEFAQRSQIVSINAEGSPVPTPSEGAKGSGTLEDPYNALAAINLANSLASGAQSSVVYIKGKVASIKEQYGTQYGNGTFYISDDGTAANQFYVFRALYLGNVKYTGGDLLKEGDEVVICGKVTNYQGNTPETVQGDAYLYSLNGVSAGGETPAPQPSEDAKGSGTLADPYNTVAAINLASALASDAKSAEVYVKGKVSSIKEQYGTQYGNGTFYISDDGTTANQFYVFRALYLGNVKYASGTLLKEGDEVVICGKLTNYKGNTPETVQGEAYLYSLNGVTESDGTEPAPTPTPSTEGTSLEEFSNGDFETWEGSIPAGWQSATTASTKNALSQSTDAHSGSYAVRLAGDAGGNKRLAYKELDLEAGDYTVTFYVKATVEGGSVRPGYVPVTDGKVGSYVYGDYVNGLPATAWTLVTYSFNLPAKTTVNLVVMNPKNPGADVLIDDFNIVKN